MQSGIRQRQGVSSAAHSLETTTVSDAMSTGVINCPPDTPLHGVARLMVDHHIHAVYVFDYGLEDDENVTPWGLVSDLDLIAAARGRFETRCAGDAAVTPLLTIQATESLDTAAEVMSLQGVAHLAVIDSTTERPIGVLSTIDIVRVLLAPEPLASAR